MENIEKTKRVKLAGRIAMICSLVAVGLGLPVQIWTNFQQASCEGLSVFMIMTMFSSWLSWLYYGKLLRNWHIIIPNIIASTFGVMLVFQFIYYNFF